MFVYWRLSYATKHRNKVKCLRLIMISGFKHLSYENRLERLALCKLVLTSWKFSERIKDRHYFRLIIRPTLIQLHYTSSVSEHCDRQMSGSALLFCSPTANLVLIDGSSWNSLPIVTFSYTVVYRRVLLIWTVWVPSTRAQQLLKRATMLEQSGSKSGGPAVIFPWGGASHHVT